MGGLDNSDKIEELKKIIVLILKPNKNPNYPF